MARLFLLVPQAVSREARSFSDDDICDLALYYVCMVHMPLTISGS